MTVSIQPTFRATINKIFVYSTIMSLKCKESVKEQLTHPQIVEFDYCKMAITVKYLIGNKHTHQF